jgi:hypothetical protein
MSCSSPIPSNHDIQWCRMIFLYFYMCGTCWCIQFLFYNQSSIVFQKIITKKQITYMLMSSCYTYNIHVDRSGATSRGHSVQTDVVAWLCRATPSSTIAMWPPEQVELLARLVTPMGLAQLTQDILCKRVLWHATPSSMIVLEPEEVVAWLGVTPHVLTWYLEPHQSGQTGWHDWFYTWSRTSSPGLIGLVWNRFTQQTHKFMTSIWVNHITIYTTNTQVQTSHQQSQRSTSLQHS